MANKKAFHDGSEQEPFGESDNRNGNLGKSMGALGFCGAYAYDLILYIAKTLTLFGRKVLVVDHSHDCEVVNIIVCADAIGETDAIDFCGVDVTQRSVCRIGNHYRISDDKGLVFDQEYDVVLIDFGLSDADELTCLCDRIYYVFDMFRHTAGKIGRFDATGNGNNGIVFRDVCKTASWRARRQQFLAIAGKSMDESSATGNFFEFPLSGDALLSRVMMEEEQTIKVRLAPEAVRNFVDKVCMELLPFVSGKTYRKEIRNR